MFDEASELFKNVKIDIREKDIMRMCKICGETYKDTQTIIEGIPSYKYAICDKCRLKRSFLYE